MSAKKNSDYYRKNKKKKKHMSPFIACICNFLIFTAIMMCIGLFVLHTLGLPAVEILRNLLI